MKRLKCNFNFFLLYHLKIYINDFVQPFFTSTQHNPNMIHWIFKEFFFIRENWNDFKDLEYFGTLCISLRDLGTRNKETA